MKLEFLFSEDEKKAWEKTIEKLEGTDWWKSFIEFLEGKVKTVSETKQAALREALLRLAKEFIPLPLSMRLFHPQLLSDFLVSQILKITDKTPDEFHRLGNELNKEIQAGETILSIPRSVFNQTDISEFLVRATAASLIISRLFERNISVLGQHASIILEGAAEDDNFAELLQRYGAVDIHNDDSFSLHLDRLAAALGDPHFISEAASYLSKYVPIEIFHGAQSFISIAISRSVLNGLVASAYAAFYTKEHLQYVNTLSKIKEKLNHVHEQLLSDEPDWTEIASQLDNVFIHINQFVTRVKQDAPLLYSISDKAGLVGVYPDLGMEVLGIYFGNFTPKEWSWLKRTQELALMIVADVEPLYRQTLYWLLLTLFRIVSIPPELEKKIKEMREKIAYYPHSLP